MQNSPLLSNICDILYNVLIVGLAFRGNLVYLFLQSWWLNCSRHSLACSRLHLHAADTYLCNITIGRWKESNSFYLVIGSFVFVSLYLKAYASQEQGLCIISSGCPYRPKSRWWPQRSLYILSHTSAGARVIVFEFSLF